MSKKIVTGTIIGVISGAVILAVAIICIAVKLVNSPEIKQGMKAEQEKQVIDFFLDQYETTEQEIRSVEIKNSYRLGHGGPFPFPGKKKNQITVYELIVNGEYKASVWVNWDQEEFSLKNTDFPGIPKLD